MKKRILSVLMVLCLVLAAVPTALAEGEDSGVTPEDPAAPTEVTEEPLEGEKPGETTPDNGLTTPAPEETSVPEEQVSPQDVGDTPTVEMDNLLVKLQSQPVRMSYTIEPAEAADDIEFVELMEVDGEWVENTTGEWGVEARDRKVSLYSGSDGIYRVSPVQQVVKGEDGKYTADYVIESVRTRVGALYNGEIIASCEIRFIPTESGIFYISADGTELSSITAFAMPTEVTAVWSGEGEAHWTWESSAPEVVGVEPAGEGSAQATVTIYQQSGSTSNVYATPAIVLDDETYVYTSTAGQISARASSGIVTASSANIYQGTEITLTFHLPDTLANAEITWSSNNKAVIAAPAETSATVNVTPSVGAPMSGAYTSVRLTAAAEIDGHTYSGYVDITVWRVTLEEDATAGTWDALLQAIQDGSQTIAVSDTIAIPADATLDLTGVQILREDFDGALFSVGSENVTINGGDTGVINGQYNGAAAPLIEVAQGGDLTLSNITLQNSQNNGGTGGAVSVKGGTLTCKGVSFIGNTAQGTTSGSNDYNGGGAIYAQDAVIDISGCTFEGNSATFGNGGTIYADQGTTGTIESNVITGGETSRATSSDSSAGGGIYCRLAGNILIRGNKISGCEAYNGGGIAVVTTGYDFCGKITLIDNTVDGNTADNRGGGLYFVQDKPDTIDLQSGIISNNSAGWGGGIDYTVHDQETLVLTNVLITDNTAVRGAGIWACPTSKTESYSTLGGAIFGNTATGRSTELNPVSASGDDIRYEGTDADVHGEDPLILRGDPWVTATTEITVMDRALGGGLMAWYQDEQSDRYASGDDEADPFLYTQTNLSFSLHGELSAAHQALAEAEARLIITGNTAESRGGGIATNSPIVIGMEGYDKTVTVEKMWSGSETHPASVNVTLVRKDEAGNTVDLETVTLSEDNEWTATFEDLPGLYEDENGTQHNYTYTVREDTIANWTGKVAETSEGNTIELVITNTYQPDPGPGGGGGTTTPDPDPDDKDDDDPEPTPTPTPTPNPDIPVTPDNPDTPDTPNQPDTPSEPVSPSDPGVPQTSDTSLTGLWLALCLLALGGLGLLRFTQPRRGGRRARR